MLTFSRLIIFCVIGVLRSSCQNAELIKLSTDEANLRIARENTCWILAVQRRNSAGLITKCHWRTGLSTSFNYCGVAAGSVFHCCTPCPITFNLRVGVAVWDALLGVWRNPDVSAGSPTTYVRAQVIPSGAMDVLFIESKNPSGQDATVSLHPGRQAFPNYASFVRDNYNNISSINSRFNANSLAIQGQISMLMTKDASQDVRSTIIETRLSEISGNVTGNHGQILNITTVNQASITASLDLAVRSLRNEVFLAISNEQSTQEAKHNLIRSNFNTMLGLIKSRLAIIEEQVKKCL